jgi:Bacterial SH3 domain
LLSCNSRAPQPRVTAVAYAGPATLNLRKELAAKSPVVGTAAYGDRLEVLETRRRFVKVRTAQGVAGWTDSNSLFTQEQMDELRHLAEQAAKLPSQGVAKAYDAVNVHAEPSRQSPSFYQVPEAGAVDVVGHRMTPRTQPVVQAHAPRKAAPKTKEKELKRTGPRPPLPPAAPPPANWEELSRPRATDVPGYEPPPPPAPVPLEDWNLVRTHNGKAGWVLARMLYMAIPDEVAQYAEGHRITAYLPLGDVKDKDQVKQNWLWTTAAGGQQTYDFDSFRVFVWSTRRHRYETAYIDRNVRGFYPVETQALPGQQAMGFSLVLEDKDGKVNKETFAFSGYHVRMTSKTPAQRPVTETGVKPARVFDPPPTPGETATRSWRQKLREWRKRWIGR